ncbi:MAG: methyltransferase domain-containing protein [Micrococcales bacterium]|nr:methyltransferase domain-containing protein [Micrococcales bacterium]
MHWDAAAYDRDFGFVTEYGRDLLSLLDVPAPASVIDIGCGTGIHAAELAARGYDVLGVDVDVAMLERAAVEHPEVTFLAGDVQTLTLDRRFDAAISNAALHWMPDQAEALRAIRAVLRPGAQFVAEMGGKRNVEIVDEALTKGVVALGLPSPTIRKFFPSVAEESTLLETAGFEVTLMTWFPRPTPLAAGQTPADWTRLFRADVWAAVPAGQHAELARLVDASCASLRSGDGWTIDYWRLRWVCHAA